MDLSLLGAPEAWVVACLAVSLGCNAGLLIAFRRFRKKPQPTFEASQLLHDLTGRGGALLEVRVKDPEGLLMWRGR